MTMLDVSKNKKLTSLYCTNTQLKVLDVSKNTGLTMLDCSSSQLEELKVSDCRIWIIWTATVTS